MNISTMLDSGNRNNRKRRTTMASPNAAAAPPSLQITDEEIMLYVEGLAAPSQARRVVAGALADTDIAARLHLLHAIAEQESSSGVATYLARFPRRADALKQEMFRIVREEVATQTETAATLATVTAKTEPAAEVLESPLSAVLRQGGGAVWRATNDVIAHLDGWLERQTTRTLAIAREVLTMPELAPATASSLPGLSLHRQAILTADNVRIEFQQLPGPVSRLRLLVDASDIAPMSLVATPPVYKTAFVTLEERVGEAHDRHVLVVLLSNDGKGFTDFSLAATNGRATTTINAVAPSQSLPPARGGCQLVGVRLSQEQSGGWETGL